MASRLFEDVFGTHVSGCVRICSCDRTHFDFSDNDWDWNEGELEEYQKGAVENPDSFIGHDYAITTVSVGGEEIVPECLCGKADKFENFIIAHAEQLAQYLNERAEKLKKEAENIKVKTN